MQSVTGLKLCRVALSAAFVSAATVAGAENAAVDYIEMFRTKILPCIHPSVKTDKAQIEIAKESAKSGDTTTTRIQAFYPGMIKNNAMQADILVRESGSIRQMRVNVLSDTSSMHGSCDMTKNWVDF